MTEISIKVGTIFMNSEKSKSSIAHMMRLRSTNRW